MATNLPGAKLYGLTSADVAKLNEDRRLMAQQRQNTRREGRAPSDLDDYNDEPGMPDTYVCLVPITGIPALTFQDAPIETGTGTGTGTELLPVPGYSEDCEIWRIVRRAGGLDATGTGGIVPILQRVTDMNRRVHNISLCEIDGLAGDTYIPVVLDRYGSWIAINPVSCTEAAGCAPPGWNRCRRVVLRAWTECVDGAIVSHEIVEYWYFCNGIVISFSNTPCPGDEGTGTGSVSPGFPECLYCAVDPGDTIQITVAGFNNGTCTDCANANGVFTLSRSESNPCHWNSTATFEVCGSSSQTYWRAIKAGSQWVVLLVANNSIATNYSSNIVDNNCDLPVTLDFLSGTTECDPAPTVELSSM